MKGKFMSNTNATTILDLYARLLTLKYLPRTGWLQRGQTNVESIAEHTFGVAMLALLIGDQVPRIDRGRLLAIALLHDMAEVLVGDLPFSARRLFGQSAKHEAERQAMHELLNHLPPEQEQEYLELWTEYHNGGSREARLVKLIDRIEMLAQALAYERAGSQVMGEFWEDIAEGWSSEFSEIDELVERLIVSRNMLRPDRKIPLPLRQKNGRTNGHHHSYEHSMSEDLFGAG